jgi:hypothetical protein
MHHLAASCTSLHHLATVLHRLHRAACRAQDSMLQRAAPTGGGAQIGRAAVAAERVAADQPGYARRVRARRSHAHCRATLLQHAATCCNRYATGMQRSTECRGLARSGRDHFTRTASCCVHCAAAWCAVSHRAVACTRRCVGGATRVVNALLRREAQLAVRARALAACAHARKYAPVRPHARRCKRADCCAHARVHRSGCNRRPPSPVLWEASAPQQLNIAWPTGSA